MYAVYQYAYSAWAPQFAERMKLSSTQTNLIVCLIVLLGIELC